MVRVGDLYFDMGSQQREQVRYQTNCPNCGAVKNPLGHKCEYCDTPYSWTTDELELLTYKFESLRYLESTQQLYEAAIRAMRHYSHSV